MDYNRLVAYIYSYNNGEKNQNAGFAKIEVRDNNLRFRINLKGAYTNGQEKWEVYLFTRTYGSIDSICIGDMFLSGGLGTFNFNGSVERIGIEFSDIKGFFIIKERNTARFFASEWDDTPFDISKIRYEDEWRKPKTPIVEYETEEVFEAAESVPNEPETSQTETILEEVETEQPTQNNTDWWSENFAGREKKLLFADDELYDVVEISLADIEKMPEFNWALMNNRFVDQGYYYFRHLIAGRIRKSGEDGYFIGVPGVYNRRERANASMYGFTRFKFSMRGDVRLGQFGYWYKELQV